MITKSTLLPSGGAIFIKEDGEIIQHKIKTEMFWERPELCYSEIWTEEGGYINTARQQRGVDYYYEEDL